MLKLRLWNLIYQSCPHLFLIKTATSISMCHILYFFCSVLYLLSSKISQDRMWGMIDYNQNAASRRFVMNLFALSLRLPLWIADVSISYINVFQTLIICIKPTLLFVLFRFPFYPVYRIMTQFSPFYRFKLLWTLHSYSVPWHNLVQMHLLCNNDTYVSFSLVHTTKLVLPWL